MPEENNFSLKDQTATRDIWNVGGDVVLQLKGEQMFKTLAKSVSGSSAKLQTDTPAPKGSLARITCDRKTIIDEFEVWQRNTIFKKKKPYKYSFFITHGEAHQQPESLVNRLVNKLAENEKLDILREDNSGWLKVIELPTTPNLDANKDLFFGRMSKYFKLEDCSNLKDFLNNTNHFNSYDFLIAPVKILGKDWLFPNTSELLKWILKEFSSNKKETNFCVLFFLFIQIEVEKETKKGFLKWIFASNSKKHDIGKLIYQDLEKINQNQDVILFDKLEDVSLGEIDDWLGEFVKIKDDRTKIVNIMASENSEEFNLALNKSDGYIRPESYKISMSEVETMLRAFIRRAQPKIKAKR